MKRIKQVPVTTERVVEKVVSHQDTIVEEEGGLASLLGKKVFLHCMNYNYSGILSGINTTDGELSEAGVVFETGPYTNKVFKDFQPVPCGKIGFKIASVEAYWELV